MANSSWITGYPLITDNTTGTTVTASGAIDDSGFLYSVIVPQASGAPSIAQVVAGQNSDGDALAANFVSSGVTVAASGTLGTMSGYALSDNTAYTMYCAASGYNLGYPLAVSGLAFTTPDVTAPTSFRGLKYDQITGSGIRLEMSLDEIGSGYCVALASGTLQPSPTEIKNAQGREGSAVAASGGLKLPIATISGYITLTTLSDETNYVVYTVAEDDDANLMASGDVSGFYFTTADITAPAWTAGYPQVRGIGRDYATVRMNLNDAGSGYVVVLEHPATQPSAAQIKLGQDSASAAVNTNHAGSTALVASTNADISITGLKTGTRYSVYVVGEDDGTNATSPAIYAGNFTTQVRLTGSTSHFSIQNIQKRRKKRIQQFMRGTAIAR